MPNGKEVKRSFEENDISRSASKKTCSSFDHAAGNIRFNSEKAANLVERIMNSRAKPTAYEQAIDWIEHVYRGQANKQEAKDVLAEFAKDLKNFDENENLNVIEKSQEKLARVLQSNEALRLVIKDLIKQDLIERYIEISITKEGEESRTMIENELKTEDPVLLSRLQKLERVFRSRETDASQATLSVSESPTPEPKAEVCLSEWTDGEFSKPGDYLEHDNRSRVFIPLDKIRATLNRVAALERMKKITPNIKPQHLYNLINPKQGTKYSHGWRVVKRVEGEPEMPTGRRPLLVKGDFIKPYNHVPPTSTIFTDPSVDLGEIEYYKPDEENSSDEA